MIYAVMLLFKWLYPCLKSMVFLLNYYAVVVHIFLFFKHNLNLMMIIRLFISVIISAPFFKLGWQINRWFLRLKVWLVSGINLNFYSQTIFKWITPTITVSNSWNCSHKLNFYLFNRLILLEISFIKFNVYVLLCNFVSFTLDLLFY